MPTQARIAWAKVYISVEKVKLIAFNVDSNSYSFCLFWNNGWCAHHSCRSDVWKLFTFQWPLTACSIVSLNLYLYFSLFAVLFIETNEKWTIRAYWSNIRFQIQCVICSNLQKKKKNTKKQKCYSAISKWHRDLMFQTFSLRNIEHFTPNLIAIQLWSTSKMAIHYFNLVLIVRPI